MVQDSIQPAHEAEQLPREASGLDDFLRSTTVLEIAVALPFRCGESSCFQLGVRRK
jgi:hypothetical protein